jgi:hypothetical protein
MVKSIDLSKSDLLKEELKARYNNLSDVELEKINDSVDQLVNSISLNTHSNQEQVKKEVESCLEYANSKGL